MARPLHPVWPVMCLGLSAGCLDYGLFGKDPDPEQGGRSQGRPDPSIADGETSPEDTAEPDDGGGITIPDDDSADTGDSGGTTDPASCADFAVPADYTVPPVSTCANRTPLCTLAPVLEWSWTTNPVISGWDNIETSPLVAQLTDDDGDGTIGSGDVPDIIVLSQGGDDYWTGQGALTALDGQTGAVHWSIQGAAGEGFNPASQATVGDLDADGVPEICVAGYSSAVVCVDGETGAFEFAAGSETSLFGGVVMADMVGDGFGEVVYGRQIFDHQGNRLGVGTGGNGGIEFYGFPVIGSVIADWDGDGQLGGTGLAASAGSVEPARLLHHQRRRRREPAHQPGQFPGPLEQLPRRRSAPHPHRLASRPPARHAAVVSRRLRPGRGARHHPHRERGTRRRGCLHRVAAG